MTWAGSAFVGRYRELAAIDELLRRSARGECVVLDVVGEPGIGKTRLLREGLGGARQRGFATCLGQASELERDVPFGLLAATFDQPLARLDADDLLPLAGDHGRRLATVFSRAAALPDGRPATGVEERHGIARAVATMIEQLASRAPLVVAVDDVQWADAASVGVLAHLLDRVSGVPLLLAFAARRGPPPRALAAAIDRAGRAGRVTHLPLGPLSPSDAGTLLGTKLDQPLRDVLMRESGGNPFYLEQLARAIGRGGGARVAGPAVPEVPQAVAQALAVELADLGAEARTVAHALAVAGDDADPELVAAVAGVAPSAALRALDELLEADIVRPAGHARTFAFRHPIVRRAIHESAPAAWRIGAHGRAAAALRDRDAPIARRAHHAEHAATAGDRDAIDLLALAAGGFLTVAPATAVRYYRAALRLLGDDEARGAAGVAIRLPLALALALTGAFDDGRDELQALLTALPDDHAPVRATIVTTMAAIEHFLGRFAESRELLSRELELVAPGEQGGRAAILQSLADNHYFVAEWAAMRDAATGAFELARSSATPALQARSAAAACVACAALGGRDEAGAWLGTARECFDTVPDATLVAHLDAPFWLGVAELHLEDYGRARRAFGRGLELARRAGQEPSAVMLGVGLACVCALTGRLAEGRRASAFAVDVARLLGVANILSWAEMGRCLIALREGRLDESMEAGAYVERAVVELGALPFSEGICALAEARVLVGEAADGRDGMLAAAGGEDLGRLAPTLRPWAYKVLTDAEVRLGELDRAQGWSLRAAESAARLGLDRDHASAGLAEARVALARGDSGRAATAALAAAEAAQRCGALPRLIHARTLAGIALGRAGDDGRAAQLLDDAHRDARACGAVVDRNEAARALRELGRRPGGRGTAPSGSHALSALSEREHEIAGLIADRLRNREIAARLHLSQKTVEYHVSRILRKLGVDSRVDVARAVDRERASRH